MGNKDEITTSTVFEVNRLMAANGLFAFLHDKDSFFIFLYIIPILDKLTWFTKIALKTFWVWKLICYQLNMNMIAYAWIIYEYII